MKTRRPMKTGFAKEINTDGVGPRTMEDLSEFQRNVLAVVAGEPVYGLGVKRELELLYGEEINHSRLYPNLDTLVDMDLVEKEARDDRTNEYSLTDEGRRELKRDIRWKLEGYVDGEEERAREMMALVDDLL